MSSGWFTWMALQLMGQAPLIDPAHSVVDFQVPLLLVGAVRGQFVQVEGGVSLEPAGWRVCARIPVHSAVMADPSRRAELLGPGFFDAARHPSARFRSVLLPSLSIPEQLEGVLEVRGVRRLQRWQVNPQGCHPPLWNGCRLRLDGVLSRSAFGMRARSAIVGDAVRLQMQIVLRTDSIPLNDAARAEHPVCAEH